MECFHLTPDPPREWPQRRDPLNRNTFPSITQELPKKFALTSKLLDQIPKTSEEGKQAL